MPPTLHRYFILDADIISSAMLFIVQLSKEMQELYKKYLKEHKEHYLREQSLKELVILFAIHFD